MTKLTLYANGELIRQACVKLRIDHNLRANDPPNAWIASCVLSQQKVPVIFGRDFARLLPFNRLQLLKPAL